MPRGQAIDKERILNTLRYLNEADTRATGRDGDIVVALATYGMQVLCGNSQNRAEIAQRIGLELDYLDAPKTEEELNALKLRWRRGCDRFRAKRRRVYDIQRRYQVSGLVPSSTELGSQIIEHPGQDETLGLIESDLDILGQYKPVLFEHWVDYAILLGMDFYEHHQDEWQPTTIDKVQGYLPLFQWATLSEDVCYVSPSQLKAQGFDTPRSEPELADDEKHHEVHLLLGTGLNLDSPRSSAWLCAANQIPFR